MRFLAQRDILLARAEERSLAEAQLYLHRQMACAQGEQAGIQRLNDELERLISARTGGCGDYINPEDLKTAKKGLLH